MTLARTRYHQTDKVCFQEKMRQSIRVYDRAASVAAPGSDACITATQWKAGCYLNLGEKEKAKELFGTVLHYDPNNKMANEILPRL